MKGLCLFLVVFLLAINSQVLKADDGGEGEGGGEEASSEAAEPEGETTEGVGESTEGEVTEGQTTEGEAQDTEALSTEEHPAEEQTTLAQTTAASVTEQAKLVSEIKIPVVNISKIDTDKIKQTMKNLTKYFDVTNNGTQEMIMKISRAFGGQISSIAGCLGVEWFKKCRYEIMKCTINPAPPMCLWNLACDETPGRCDKKTKFQTTTQATTLSPGRALMRSAMKAAGLTCDRLKTCLGKGVNTMLENINSTMQALKDKMKDKMVEASGGLKGTTKQTTLVTTIKP